MSGGNTAHRRLLRKSLRQRPQEATHLVRAHTTPRLPVRQKRRGTVPSTHGEAEQTCNRSTVTLSVSNAPGQQGSRRGLLSVTIKLSLRNLLARWHSLKENS